MSRRNPEEEQETPEQETPETEEEQETPEDQEEQEQDPEAEEQPEEEEQEETPEDQEEDQQEQPPADSGSDETAALRRDLLQAQSRLAAFTAGVAPAMIDDAVTLAMAEAAKSGGEVTDASVAKAMETVLQRHPEWKTQDDKRKTGGFKLGGDRDSGTPGRKTDTKQNVKRWNRFK
ncbi:MAG: hypothetical protein IJ960_06770 [Oscillospiraceae bacterium]|nr:hypothetical protein [Oscillospiraceae bacterium]